jgi:predicted metal-dependent hydrolase
MNDYEVSYGNQKIPFELVRSKRKTLETQVKPDGSVEVRAPIELETSKILEIVSKRGRWITRKKLHFQQYPKEELRKKYVSGETHRYLGKQYRLKVIPSETYQVKLKGGYIEIHSPVDSPQIVEELLYNWYRSHADKKFDQILDQAMEVVRKHGISKPEIKIKRMKRRWGSCIHGKNRIHLNLELIRAPSYCISYVIYHELVHQKVPNHQKKYYSMLNQILPDWKERKYRLEKVNLY